MYLLKHDFFVVASGRAAGLAPTVPVFEVGACLYAAALPESNMHKWASILNFSKEQIIDMIIGPFSIKQGKLFFPTPTPTPAGWKSFAPGLCLWNMKSQMA